MSTEKKEENIKSILLSFIQHNSRHYIELNLLGKRIFPCARCFGLWTGIIIGFFLTSPFWIGLLYINNFLLVFIIAWIFVIPSIVDWISVKCGLRKGSNKIRFSVGFFHGIGIIVYFFILPADLIFKVVTYTIYEVIFFSIRRILHVKHYKLENKKL